MKKIEIARIAFVDPVNRVLFEERKGLSNNDFNYGYLLFGEKLEDGESPEDTIRRKIMEELIYELNGEKFSIYELNGVRYFRTYESDLEGTPTTDHVYVAKLPRFNGLRSLESRTLALMPISSARRTKIPPIYHQIFQDLETALRDPNFLSVLK